MLTLTPRALGEEIPKIKKHLNKLIENNKKGLTFNLGEILESERFPLIKLAIKEKVDWDIDSNIGLISEKEIIGTFKLLIEAREGWAVAKNLDKIPKEHRVEIAELIIKAKEGECVADNLDKIPKEHRVEIIELIIKEGKGYSVAGNLGKIPEEDRLEIIYILIEAGEGFSVAENIEKIPKEHRFELAKLLIKEGNGYSVAKNLDKISEEHRFELAKLLIKEGNGYSVADNLDKIQKEYRLKIAKLIIKSGEGYSIASLVENIDKISEEHRFEVAKLLIESGEACRLIKNLEKIPETKIVEVVELLIKSKEYRAVAENLEKIPETKIIKVVELLIEAGEGYRISCNSYKIPESKIIKVVELLIEAEEGWKVVRNLDKISETKIVEVINLLIEKGVEYRNLLAYFIKYKNEITENNIIKINEYIKQNYHFNTLEEMINYSEPKVKDFWNSKMFDINEEINSLVSVMIAKDVPGISKEGVKNKIKEYNKTNIEKPFDTRYENKEIEVSLAKIEFNGIGENIQKNINTLKSIVNNIDLNKPGQFKEIYNQIKNKLENAAIDERDIKTIKIKDEVLEIIDNHKKNIPDLLSKVNFLSQKKNLDISNDLRKIIILYSLRKQHNRFSSLKSCLNNDITIESLKEIEEIISELITNGELSKYFETWQKTYIKKLLYCNHLEHEIKSNKKIDLNDKTKIKLHFSKDYLTNFTKSISCTCYSDINILKEAPNATSIIFYINDKPAGSCILQDTLDKDDNKITIISELNPQNSYLTKINCQEFVSNFLEVIKDTCIKRKTIPCIVLDSVSGLTTNRIDIFRNLYPLKLENKRIEVKDYDDINYGSLEFDDDIYRL